MFAYGIAANYFAYDIAAKYFCGYFQMSLQFASTIYNELDEKVTTICAKEYLRTLAKRMLNLFGLPKAEHKVDRHMGSLDCIYASWKNYPVSWKGQ
jgi:hypothetical protein